MVAFPAYFNVSAYWPIALKILSEVSYTKRWTKFWHSFQTNCVGWIVLAPALACAQYLELMIVCSTKEGKENFIHHSPFLLLVFSHSFWPCVFSYQLHIPYESVCIQCVNECECVHVLYFACYFWKYVCHLIFNPFAFAPYRFWMHFLLPSVSFTVVAKYLSFNLFACCRSHTSKL